MMRCEVTFAALEACVTASSLTKRWQDRFCCILKNSTKVQVSSFKPKPVFILTDNINYRCCQSIYIVALIVLEHYLYMMLSEEKLLTLCSLLWITHINEQRCVCSFKIYSCVSQKYLIFFIQLLSSNVNSTGERSE